MFQHTAARRRLLQLIDGKRYVVLVSTHSRPKAAARGMLTTFVIYFEFQHTAARRRLLKTEILKAFICDVSTHSRPKAAAYGWNWSAYRVKGFNTQPPEGGCIDKIY